MNVDFGKIDLHMHTNVSDGTDTPEEIVSRVMEAGIGLFSVTDHDAVKSSQMIAGNLPTAGLSFITGVEFSCKDEKGKYHILGYGYDPNAETIKNTVSYGHLLRMKKVRARLDFLKQEFGFAFPEEELAELTSLDNPGKPHIANMMVRNGYAETKEQAIRDFINKLHFRSEHLRPEEAIAGILSSGGIPVLAHPSYGDGEQVILGDEMEDRIRHLMDCGLRGLECFYSGFTPKLLNETLHFAEKFDLYVTAGSDYHGGNKLEKLGDTWLETGREQPPGLQKFLEDVRIVEGSSV